ncbi:nitroreductase family protein [uncultured Rikenella sp.]|uniref:nitroreductase family protein n=1 Tax=uncultured Rikenella sp. TaxID=368003 RepID=UPI002614035F|nr:nitroreductase family protein [uncultured Rikenella sp.]
MKFTLDIHSSTCIRCGRCVAVCPSRILTQAEPKAPVGIERPETCIVCGHCVAACPTGAVTHTEFPAEKVHPVDRNALPTAEQVLELCRARRSNRALIDRPVPRDLLEQIVEAAHRAPTASNRQEVSFIVVTDPEKLKQIIQLTLDTFDGVRRKLENPVLRPLLRRVVPQVYAYLPAFRRLIEAWGRGEDLVLRGAQAVVFICAPADSRFGVTDTNLAYENGSLMAESLGVSQIYTGFVLSAMKQDRKGRFAQLLGVGKGRKVYAGMALGMPKFAFPNYIDKKPVEVQWLEER